MKNKSVSCCPECGSSRSSVVLSRDTVEGNRIRRRVCLSCEGRWYSVQPAEKVVPAWAVSFSGRGTNQSVMLHGSVLG